MDNRPAVRNGLFVLGSVLLVGIAYYIGAVFGAHYTITVSGLVIFWPPNAVLLAAFILSSPKVWPWFALAALSAEIIVDVPDFPLWVAVSFGLINVAECLLAILLLKRFTKSDFSFDRSSNVGYFLLAGPLVASATAAVAGAIVYLIMGRDDSGFATLWRLWWFGDAIGLLLLTPLFVSVVRYVQAGNFEFNWARASEFMLLLVSIIVVSPLIFSNAENSIQNFDFTPMILLPLLIWAALRFQIVGTTVAVALVGGIVAYQLTQGASLYGSPDRAFNVWLAQETLAILSVISVGLTVFLNELRYKNQLLEQRVRERTLSLEEANQSLNDANERLQQMASTDYLMGIDNRREFDHRALRQMTRLQHESKTASLIMFDLDHFKKVNDLYGHDVGDKVLQNMVEPVLKTLRPTDLFARYGGEEFLVLLPEAGLDDAVVVAERLRHSIADTLTDAGAQQISVTCSLGVALWDGRDSLDTLISKADKALYQAKQSGRNRVCVSQ